MSGSRRWAIRVAALLVKVVGLGALTPTLALAGEPQLLSPPPLTVPFVQPLATGDLPPPMLDGRMLGHLPYAEVSRADLVAAPGGFALGQACFIHRDAAPDLVKLLTAAALAPGVGKSLRGVSCFRTVAHQRAVFCRNAPVGRCGDPARRARFVGPPGYSEHATGYALDFGIRPSRGCADVDACLATTPAGRWLLAHAADYGFELSFPAGNAQGVTWEPWHWRWVGGTVNAPGAARARLVFARARASYPASPAVDGAPDPWRVAPPVWPSVRPPAILPSTIAPTPFPTPTRSRSIFRP